MNLMKKLEQVERLSLELLIGADEYDKRNSKIEDANVSKYNSLEVEIAALEAKKDAIVANAQKILDNNVKKMKANSALASKARMASKNIDKLLTEEL